MPDLGMVVVIVLVTFATLLLQLSLYLYNLRMNLSYPFKYLVGGLKIFSTFRLDHPDCCCCCCNRTRFSWLEFDLESEIATTTTTTDKGWKEHGTKMENQTTRTITLLVSVVGFTLHTYNGNGSFGCSVSQALFLKQNNWSSTNESSELHSNPSWSS